MAKVAKRSRRPAATRRRKKAPDSPKTDDRFYFDEEIADRACRFFEEYLRHTTGEWAGQPFVLAAYQRDFVRQLVGWRRKSDGTRRYRRAGLFIPRKAGKTTLLSGLAAYFLFCDDEPRATIYSLAGDREQAALLFDDAKRMIEGSPKLEARCQRFKRSVLVTKGKAAGSTFQVLSSDAKLKHGLNPHVTLFDELHVQPNRRLWEAFTSARGARRQPLLIWISTAGYDTDSLCYEQYEHACKVRDGIIEDPSFLPVIYEASKDDDWRDEKTWKKAHPNFGVTPKREYYEERLLEAENNPAELNNLLRFDLNVWTEAIEAWIPIDKWDASAKDDSGKIIPVREADLAGRECFAGLDLSSVNDLTTEVLLFPEPDGSFLVLPRFWIPQAQMQERIRKHRVPYDVWKGMGLVQATPGDAIDYDFIQAQLEKDHATFKVKEFAYDKWNAEQLAINLMKAGLPMVEFRQGFVSMSAPSKDLMVKILRRRIRHGGNQVLRWNASNVHVTYDPAGNIKPVKPKPNSPKKIDGIIGLVMALGRAVAHQKTDAKTGPSRYEQAGSGLRMF
jgi:phage terminase large subunit-like protein